MSAPPATVLVVDDEPQMLHNLATILRVEGYRVLAARDGREGLAIARSERPDLVVCDIMMPGLSGLDVLDALRADPELAATPLVFLTARGEARDLRAGMNQGADDYLTKPVRIDELLASVRVRLERRRQQAAPAGPPAPANPSGPAELIPLGVSPREADVLFWLLQGKSNAEIGTILGVSAATVKKHLEHIFTKLGVENRSAAIVCTLDRWRAARDA